MADQPVVFIAFPGAPFQSTSLDDAEEWAVRLLEQHDDLRHVTILAVPATWRTQDALVVENRGIVGTTPTETARPYLTFGSEVI